MNFRTWHLHGVHDEGIDPVVLLINDESFYLIGCRKSQNSPISRKSHSDQQNSITLCCGWCIMSAPRIIWPIIWDHKFTSVVYFPTLCSQHLSLYERTFVFFQQANGVAHTASSFMHCLQYFDNRITGRWMWPAYSPHCQTVRFLPVEHAKAWSL